VSQEISKGGLPTAIMARLHAPVYASRLRELVRLIIPRLKQADQILDVGCGSGALGRTILDDPCCPLDVKVLGLERARRRDCLIEVGVYDGGIIPYTDRSYDVVILADVLHHAADPDQIFSECVRVSRRLLVIKDHQLKGFLAYARVSLIDWAANTPYGVPCLYRYYTPAQWEESNRRHGLRVLEEFTSMSLYPYIYNLLFGGSLQYMVIAEVPEIG